LSRRTDALASIAPVGLDLPERSHLEVAALSIGFVFWASFPLMFSVVNDDGSWVFEAGVLSEIAGSGCVFQP
jgi:hypothetical protein